MRTDAPARRPSPAELVLVAASLLAVFALACPAQGQDGRDAAGATTPDRCGDELDGLWHGFARHFFPAPRRPSRGYLLFESHHGAFYSTSDVFLWIHRVDGALHGAAMVRSWSTTDGDSITPECGPGGWNDLERLTLVADPARGPRVMVNSGDPRDSIEHDCGEHAYAERQRAEIRIRAFYRFELRHAGVDTLQVTYRQGAAHVGFIVTREACSCDTPWPSP